MNSLQLDVQRLPRLNIAEQHDRLRPVALDRGVGGLEVAMRIAEEH
jgi:hypothetical protein